MTPPQAAGASAGQGRQEQLQATLAPVVANAGYDLESLAISAAGRRSVLKVVIDRDAGVTLDDVTLLSKAIGAVLDVADPLGATPYTLEVTSPGVDRPLTEARHWRRAIGRLVAATLDGRPVEGRVSGVDGDTVKLEVDGTPVEQPRGALGPGRVQIEFSRRDDPADEAGPDRPTRRERPARKPQPAATSAHTGGRATKGRPRSAGQEG